MILSQKTLGQIAAAREIQIPDETVFALPEKVLQFGTGVLLRGLPDYFIDKANKQHIFNGRVVVVKSTGSGGVDAFAAQNGLYTQLVRGITDGSAVDECIINASVSRVLSAKTAWQDILQCAADANMQVIISNTTEVGISLMKEDDIRASPPASFPGKLLAFLYHRFMVFNGDYDKGLVIIPTELVPFNGQKLAGILNELAAIHKLEDNFLYWLTHANHFCDSLVDRIVPGRLAAEEQKAVEQVVGYGDELMIMSEPYRLWAIQSASEKVKKILSFAEADPGVVIAPDIAIFRELKLRLLNGTHTLSCGLAFLSGFRTVKEAMDDKDMSAYIAHLMLDEIAAAITADELTPEKAEAFARQVLDRFRNPFIEHQWLSITMQYSSKIKMRDVPVLLKYYERYGTIPERIALGFAAHLLFMRCEKAEDGSYYGLYKGKPYLVQDDSAADYSEQWQQVGAGGIVSAVLGDTRRWGADLNALPGFTEAVDNYLKAIMNADGKEIIRNLQVQKNTN